MKITIELSEKQLAAMEKLFFSNPDSIFEMQYLWIEEFIDEAIDELLANETLILFGEDY